MGSSLSPYSVAGARRIALFVALLVAFMAAVFLVVNPSQTGAVASAASAPPGGWYCMGGQWNPEECNLYDANGDGATNILDYNYLMGFSS